VGGGGVVSWGERVSDGRSLACVWAKCLFAPRGVARQVGFLRNLQKHTYHFEKGTKKHVGIRNSENYTTV